MSQRVKYTDHFMSAGHAFSTWMLSTRLGRTPQMRRALSSLRQVVLKCAVPNRLQWVRIRSGFAEGLWFRLHLAEERNWWAGRHELWVQDCIREHVCKNTVFYDVGSHIGFFALPAARVGARVIALEAEPESASRLREHVERNGLERKITVMQLAAWSRSNERVAFRQGWPKSQSGVEEDGAAPVLARGPLIEVDTVAIDDLVATGSPVPNLIKIDVEGGEAYVLRGAMRTLEQHHPELLIEVHHRTALSGVEDILSRFSYTAEWNIPAEGFPRHCFAQHA